MQLNKEQRSSLFQTPVLSRQIRKCVEAKGSMSERDLRSIFLDVPSNHFFNAVRQLVVQGVLTRKDAVVSFNGNGAQPPKGTTADRVWKAAVQLGCFTIEELVRISEVNWEYVEKLLLRWARGGHVTKVASRPKSVFRMTSKLNTRPVAGFGRDRKEEKDGDEQ
jgi:hypothetical protein